MQPSLHPSPAPDRATTRCRKAPDRAIAPRGYRGRRTHESGRYYFAPKPDDPNLTNFQAYFGTDQTRYPAQSPINYVKAAKPMPTFIVISEYDNPDLDTQGALLFGALCERDRACPRFTRMELHNHLSMVCQFNTADDALGRQILEFIRRGR
jgi:acetyl esterase